MGRSGQIPRSRTRASVGARSACFALRQRPCGFLHGGRAARPSLGGCKQPVLRIEELDDLIEAVTLRNHWTPEQIGSGLRGPFGWKLMYERTQTSWSFWLRGHVVALWSRRRIRGSGRPASLFRTGGNFLDTAAIYGPYRNEELIARFVREIPQMRRTSRRHKNRATSASSASASSRRFIPRPGAFCRLPRAR